MNIDEIFLNTLLNEYIADNKTKENNIDKIDSITKTFKFKSKEIKKDNKDIRQYFIKKYCFQEENITAKDLLKIFDINNLNENSYELIEKLIAFGYEINIFEYSMNSKLMDFVNINNINVQLPSGTYPALSLYKENIPKDEYYYNAIYNVILANYNIKLSDTFIKEINKYMQTNTKIIKISLLNWYGKDDSRFNYLVERKYPELLNAITYFIFSNNLDAYSFRKLLHEKKVNSILKYSNYCLRELKGNDLINYINLRNNFINEITKYYYNGDNIKILVKKKDKN